MPSRARTMFILVCLMLGLQSAAKADTLLGTAVTRQLSFMDLNVNYFDPANFLVPSSGYGNSVSLVNVTIVNSGIEFGIDDGFNRDSAEFTASTLTVTDLCLSSRCSKNIPFTMFFTDTAFTFISKISDSIGSGGLSYSLTGDIIELDWAGFPTDFPMNTNGDRLKLYQAKTGEPVSVLVPTAVSKALTDLKPKSDWFFWSGASKMSTVTGFWWERISKVFKQAKLEKAHSHMFRDTFAVALLNAGASLETVSTLLGHTSIRVTQKHYNPWVKSRQDALDAAVSSASIRTPRS
jgi:Phage integrase family